MNKEQLKESLEEYAIQLKFDEKSNSSIAIYLRYANLFISFISHDHDINKMDVMNFKKYVIDVLEFSSKTTQLVIISVNKFLKFCKLDDFKVKQIRIQTQSTIDEILKPSDFKRLLRIAKRIGDMQIYYIMKTLAYTGIRNEELKFFTFEAVKSKKMCVLVKNKGKERKVPIPQQLRKELLKYCKDEGIANGVIFRSPKNNTVMLHRSTIFKRLKKIAGIAKVKKSLVHAHAFRHLFAITYLENGGNSLDLMNILGHNSIETTRTYILKTQDQLRKQVENKIKY